MPTTVEGTRLLCSIVDNVEALIDEWFPGLRDIDIVNGTQLVTPMSLCPLCDGEEIHAACGLKDRELETELRERNRVGGGGGGEEEGGREKEVKL